MAIIRATKNDFVTGDIRVPLHCFKVIACISPALLLLAAGASGQIIPTKPAPLTPQVPTGTGVCSIEKSCAELAPAMIQSAQGQSPLEENLRYLSDVIGGRVTGTPAADRAAGWAVEAFRRAGVDEVHTEKFTIPVGWSEGNPRLEILAPESFPVRLVSIGWSPATPQGGGAAEIRHLGFGGEGGFWRG